VSYARDTFTPFGATVYERSVAVRQLAVVEAVDLAKLYVFPEWVVHSAFTVFLSVRLMAEFKNLGSNVL
jgi:hypothetical protein